MKQLKFLQKKEVAKATSYVFIKQQLVLCQLMI